MTIPYTVPLPSFHSIQELHTLVFFLTQGNITICYAGNIIFAPVHNEPFLEQLTNEYVVATKFQCGHIVKLKQALLVTLSVECATITSHLYTKLLHY